jgi:hypothetical protein
MFAMNKDVLVLVSLACALVAVFYIYKDLQKTKLEVQKLSETPVHHAAPAPQPVQQKPVQKKAPAPEITVADE